MTTIINMAQAAQQAKLVKVPKKNFAIQQSIEYSSSDSIWLLMIRDLIEGAGYNYSRIAKKVGVCPSAIQKLITHPDRRPRLCVLEQLLVLYHQVFHGPYITERAKNYLQNHSADVLKQLPPSWVKRLVANASV
jgi:hypothetical protein